jgi:hypothetical protein
MKYEKKAECPPKLKDLIELVNLLPDSDPQTVKKELYEVIFNYDWDNNYFGHTLFDEVEYFLGSGRLTQHLFNKIESEADYEGTIDVFSLCDHFADLVRTKSIFIKIAESYNNSVENSGERQYELRRRFNKFRFEFSTELIVNNQGFLKPRHNEFVELFAKENIQASRIRICVICSQIFWAKKTNAETCGEKNCASTLYNRRRLEKLKQERLEKVAVWEQKKRERANWINRDFSSEGDLHN